MRVLSTYVCFACSGGLKPTPQKRSRDTNNRHTTTVLDEFLLLMHALLAQSELSARFAYLCMFCFLDHAFLGEFAKPEPLMHFFHAFSKGFFETHRSDLRVYKMSKEEVAQIQYISSPNLANSQIRVGREGQIIHKWLLRTKTNPAYGGSQVSSCIRLLLQLLRQPHEC